MKISEFSNYLSRIEQTPSRNDMTLILAELFTQARSDEIDKMVYLSLGVLSPAFRSVEFNMSEKLILKSLNQLNIQSKFDVEQRYKMIGDLGEVAVEILQNKKTSDKYLSVSEVYARLFTIATSGGTGSQEGKILQMADLINSLDILSAKYIVRIPVGKLRLGFSDVTILDALSIMLTGDKSNRVVIENAFNVSADIGFITKVVKEKGINGAQQVVIQPGTPIRLAAAERLPSADAIIQKLGKVTVEPKIDGFRLQCHFQKSGFKLKQSNNNLNLFNQKDTVRLFSRNLEDLTLMFPDIVAEIQKINVNSIILDGEAVAYNPDTGEFLPFQETIQRRRIHNVNEKVLEIPLKYFAFDVLYLNGESLIDKPLYQRRKVLADKVGNRQGLARVIECASVETSSDLSTYFNKQISQGLEGVMVKRIDAPYSAGTRNFNWVKLKRDQKGELNDTIDCVVLGYKFGKGKRTNFGIGAFIVGVYDDKTDTFKTLTNVGTGLTDDQWREMKGRSEKLVSKTKPARYDVPATLEQDVWIKPSMVVEILADEITRSPLHTAGIGKDGVGYALRFPRLISWKDDREPEQATTVKELIEMFNHQKKRSGKI